MNPNLIIKINDISEGADYQVIAFNGEFDKAGQSEVKEDLEKAVKDFKGKHLIFDFHGLKFINSEGIGYLTEIHSHLKKAGSELVVVAPKPNVEDVFQAIGLHEILPVHKDLKGFLATAK